MHFPVVIGGKPADFTLYPDVRLCPEPAPVVVFVHVILPLGITCRAYLLHRYVERMMSGSCPAIYPLKNKNPEVPWDF